MGYLDILLLDFEYLGRASSSILGRLTLAAERFNRAILMLGRNRRALSSLLRKAFMPLKHISRSNFI